MAKYDALLAKIGLTEGDLPITGAELHIRMQIDDELSALLKRAGLHPAADQAPGGYPLYPMTEDELHRQLHGTSLTGSERETTKRGLIAAGLISE